MSYFTLAKKTLSEETIEKSKFIAHVSPVSSREEAEYFFKEIRKKHYDATHNVPAFVIGEKADLQWASDDGEPQGTSGYPILNMLVKMNMTNTAVIVTRYFGGIKLGPGGLMRAYTSVTKKAIEKAGLMKIKDMLVLIYEISYEYWPKIEQLAARGLLKIGKVDYQATIKAEIIICPQLAPDVKTLIKDNSLGSAILLSVSIDKQAFPVVK